MGISLRYLKQVLSRKMLKTKNVKKKIPLQVLEIIEPYVNKNGEIFESIDPSDFLLKFIDKDANSDFHFIVETFKNENGFQLLINWKPANKQTTSNKKIWVKSEQLDSYFNNWLKLLDGYNNVKTVFDDPILEAFADEYFTEFEILDEDSDIKPFSTKQALLLDTHLESIQLQIEKFQTQENKTEIEQIKKDVEVLRNNLTRKSKKWVLKHVSIIWAQITKQGPKLMKEFLSETKKHALKEGIKFLFDNGSNLIS